MNPPLYVLVYPSRLFATHWSFWIPYPDASGQESDIGDHIHVTGDRLNGFQYEYVQNYNVREDERKPNSSPIGSLSTASVSEEMEGGRCISGGAAEKPDVVNPFDRVCREVKPPDPSLNKVIKTAAGRGAGVPLTKTEAKDCQWWIKRAVAHLVETGMLSSLDVRHEAGNPNEIVEGLPRN